MASPDKVQVDSHAYLMGRERPVMDKENILGRHHDDSAKLFPRFTHASAAVTGEVVINGLTVKLWTFEQLESLSRAVLRERAMVIRDALGEDGCPPIPSGHSQDVIRWILQMQSQLTNQEPTLGRSRGHGTGHEVPLAFAQDHKERPITREREAPAEKGSPVPFGIGRGHEHTATRDNFGDLKYQRNAFKDPPNLGIQTMRPGGEGKRHIPAKHNMVCCGVSEANVQGIETLKASGEGRRHLACNDHLMEQKRDMLKETQASNVPVKSCSQRAGVDPVRHVSESHMSAQGLAEPLVEAHIGGDRRRHANPPDRLVNHGTSAPEQDVTLRTTGRKYLDGFAGPRSEFRDAHSSYQSNWKKDPKKLLGTSMLV
mmetsp:Transcript_119715/g.233057  ORF Transcript_119715/g.233057 Transcript_119715/m.233057 type:complete len:371 (-) Transcript_119715:256-1368(-)|eukprot:CAMPEP_0172721196 /NCGR_PEP_ID=MMETSP1074-20121228/78549_1 /TAXON_ID=2916 /ORGANISM="Ceratium fusus, Strain PA161109" /LENGTH=370 /DNA_ID=CAMNT_0013546881 /DNA_START=55 /DNA_END=1167 /DNA_ORIENTATION=+